MNKKVMSIAIAGLIGVSLLSVGLVKNNVFAARIDNKTKVELSKEERNDLNLTNAKVKVNKDDAMKLALNQYKDGKVQKVKLDNEDGKLIYEIDMVVSGFEHDIDIDAKSGKILKDEVDDQDDDENKEATITQFAKITIDQVKSIVMDKYKDGTITEVDLENENGNMVYEVEVNTIDGVRDIIVDARNGKILIDELDD